jgi:6-pyruvoyl-tetrahydropterin synthase
VISYSTRKYQGKVIDSSDMKKTSKEFLREEFSDKLSVSVFGDVKPSLSGKGVSMRCNRSTIFIRIDSLADSVRLTSETGEYLIRSDKDIYSEVFHKLVRGRMADPAIKIYRNAGWIPISILFVRVTQSKGKITREVMDACDLKHLIQVSDNFKDMMLENMYNSIDLSETKLKLMEDRKSYEEASIIIKELFEKKLMIKFEMEDTRVIKDTPSVMGFRALKIVSAMHSYCQSVWKGKHYMSGLTTIAAKRDKVTSVPFTKSQLDALNEKSELLSDAVKSPIYIDDQNGISRMHLVSYLTSEHIKEIFKDQFTDDLADLVETMNKTPLVLSYKTEKVDISEDEYNDRILDAIASDIMMSHLVPKYKETRSVKDLDKIISEEEFDFLRSRKSAKTLNPTWIDVNNYIWPTVVTSSLSAPPELILKSSVKKEEAKSASYTTPRSTSYVTPKATSMLPPSKGEDKTKKEDKKGVKDFKELITALPSAPLSKKEMLELGNDDSVEAILKLLVEKKISILDFKDLNLSKKSSRILYIDLKNMFIYGLSSEEKQARSDLESFLNESSEDD